MNITDFAAVPAIVVVVYLIAYFLKAIGSEKLNRLLPPVCGALGLVLSVVCYFALPDYIPAENWLSAAAIGIVSGFAATGVHQVYKQAVKED